MNKRVKLLVLVVVPFLVSFNWFKKEKRIYLDGNVDMWVDYRTKVGTVMLKYALPPNACYIMPPKRKLTFISRSFGRIEAVSEETVYSALYNYYKPHSPGSFEFAPEMIIREYPKSVIQKPISNIDDFYEFLYKKRSIPVNDSYSFEYEWLPEGGKSIILHDANLKKPLMTMLKFEKTRIGDKECVYVKDLTPPPERPEVTTTGTECYIPLNQEYYVCMHFSMKYGLGEEVYDALDLVIKDMLFNFSIEEVAEPVESE